MKKKDANPSFIKGYFKFIKTSGFFKHLLLALVSLCLVSYLLFKFLGIYTGHGEKVEVPDFTNKSVLELKEFTKDLKIGFKIVDSVYMPKSKPGIVIKQEPKSGSNVKSGRFVYLFVTTLVPPQMEMPQLAERSYRQAVFMIQSFGLKLGKTTYEIGFPGAVLKQIVDGKVYTAEEIKEAKRKNKPILIRKGSKVSLVVGKEEEKSLDSVKQD
jgi:hypothetical protein